MRLERAADFASYTSVIAIGISEYRDPTLTRPFLAAQAKRLCIALGNTALANIPRDNLTALTDGEATLANIVAALRRVLGSADPAHTILVYFAGHSYRDSMGRQWLLPHDATIGEADATGLDVQEFAAMMQASPAKSIVVFLDCCHSSGVAEAIMSKLSLPKNADCRGIIAASRTDEESYVFPEVGTLFSRALINVLEGSAVIGMPPGVLHFDALSRYLQAEVSEKLEIIGHPDAQHVVAAQWTTGGDTLLFVIAKVTGANLSVAPQRYSAEYVRRRLLRFATISLFTISTCVAMLYVIADGQQYADIESQHVVIRRGFPQLTLPRLPTQVWESDITQDSLLPGSVLARKAALTTRPFQPILPDLLRQLKSVDRVQVESWQSNRAQTITDLASLTNAEIADDTNNVLDGVIRSLGRLDPRSIQDQRILSRFAGRDDGYGEATFDLLTRASPIEAITRAKALPRDEQGSAVEGVMDGLRSGCNKAVRSLLESSIALPDSTFPDSYWPESLLHSRCVINNYDVILEYRYYQTQDILPLITYALVHPNRGITEAIVREYDEKIRRSRVGERATDDLYYLTVTNAATVPEQTRSIFQTKDLGSLAVEAAARALVVKHPSMAAELFRAGLQNPWITVGLIEAGERNVEFVRRALRDTAKADDPAFYGLLRAIRRSRSYPIVPTLRALQRNTRLNSLQVGAIIVALEALNVKPQEPAALISSLGPDPNPESASVVTGWLASDLASRAFALQNLSRFPALSSRDFARGIGMVALGKADLEFLDHSSSNTDNTHLYSAIDVAMQGQPIDVALQLESPDFDVRQVATEYAAYNRNLPEIVDALTHAKTFPNPALSRLSQELRLKTRFEEDINALPGPLRLSRVNGLLALYNTEGSQFEITDGLRIWIEEMRRKWEVAAGRLQPVGGDPDDPFDYQ